MTERTRGGGGWCSLLSWNGILRFIIRLVHGDFRYIKSVGYMLEELGSGLRMTFDFRLLMGLLDTEKKQTNADKTNVNARQRQTETRFYHES